MASQGSGRTGLNRLVVLVALLAVVIAVIAVLIDNNGANHESPSTGSTSAVSDDPFLSFGLKTAKGEASGPSGVGMPTSTPAGYLPVFADDFPASQDVKLGQFSGCKWRGSLPKSVCTGLPAGPRSQWWAYPAGGRDTSGHGTYEPGQVVTIGNGIMSFHLHTNSTTHRPVVAAVEPRIPALDSSTGSIRFGAYAVRYRAESIPGYELEFQLFPDGHTWPKDGSIELPAGYTNHQIEGVLHWYGAKVDSQQDIFSRANDGRWHTAVVQWAPDRVVFMLDGKVIGIVRTHIPQRALHLVLQTQTGVLGPAPAPTVFGSVQVAWVTEFELAPGAAA